MTIWSFLMKHQFSSNPVVLLVGDLAEKGEIVRKQIIPLAPGASSTSSAQELNITDLATVLVTSEAPDFPVENAFDGQHGAGGSRWMAVEPGEQTLIVAFDVPQILRRIVLEVEEREVERTQEVDVALSEDGGRTYRELLRQEYTFSPVGATFEREEWAVSVQKVTHVRVRIKPDKGGRPCRATLTTLAFY